MANKQDARVQKLIKAVQKRKEAISKTERAIWITNGSFRYAEDSTQGTFNLQVIADVTVLAKALAFLIGKEQNIKEACDRLNIKGDFKWLGYTVKEWQEDFQTRVNKINIATDKKQLAVLEKQLESLMSEDLKTDMQLAEIEALLKD